MWYNQDFLTVILKERTVFSRAVVLEERLLYTNLKDAAKQSLLGRSNSFLNRSMEGTREIDIK